MKRKEKLGSFFILFEPTEFIVNQLIYVEDQFSQLTYSFQATIHLFERSFLCTLYQELINTDTRNTLY
jgi:hypothetical protein